ncbi:MAG: hypothetical protein V9G08_07320 [Dermatophilaceae bacterium]
MATNSTPITTTNDPPTSSAPTADPRLPPAARADSIEGAQEFVKYFMAQLALSWTEPNPSLLPPLCMPESKTCSAYTAKAQEYKDNGRRYVGTLYEVHAVLSFRWAPGTAAVRVTGLQPAGKVVNSSGSVIESVPASAGGLVFTLEHRDGWRVREIHGEAPAE